VYLKLSQLSDRFFTTITLALIAGFVAFSSLLIRFDNLHYDLGRYLTFKPAPADIVIVAIDEASLESVGRWPWSRIVHADLVNKLNQEQARAIGLDIIFSEPELSNPEADLVLANAIKKLETWSCQCCLNSLTWVRQSKKVCRCQILQYMLPH
jgi:CHASE2 domain-containing sensor protein